jgi:hypothetical protein
VFGLHFTKSRDCQRTHYAKCYTSPEVRAPRGLNTEGFTQYIEDDRGTRTVYGLPVFDSSVKHICVCCIVQKTDEGDIAPTKCCKISLTYFLILYSYSSAVATLRAFCPIGLCVTWLPAGTGILSCVMTGVEHNYFPRRVLGGYHVSLMN